jgi:hypothetical protein
MAAVCADATQYKLPEGPLVLYFNGPFDDEALLEAVLASIAAELHAQPRPAYLVYSEAVVVTWPDAVLEKAGFRRLGKRRVVRFDLGSMRHAQWFGIYTPA